MYCKEKEDSQRRKTGAVMPILNAFVSDGRLQKKAKEKGMPCRMP